MNLFLSRSTRSWSREQMKWKCWVVVSDRIEIIIKRIFGAVSSLGAAVLALVCEKARHCLFFDRWPPKNAGSFLTTPVSNTVCSMLVQINSFCGYCNPCLAINDQAFSLGPPWKQTVKGHSQAPNNLFQTHRFSSEVRTLTPHWQPIIGVNYGHDKPCFAI